MSGMASLRATTQLTASCSSRRVCLPISRRAGRALLSVRAQQQYDVDVEPQAPNTAPRWGSGPPPPPPPPPPQPPKTGNAPVSRREALFAALGLGVGAAGTAGFYNTQYDLSPESMNAALDELLEDPEFLDMLSDEVLYREFGNQLDGFSDNADALEDIDRQLNQIKSELEKAVQDD